MSRLWKIGSIFSRLSGMIEGGHLKSTDIPIWYSIYKRFPAIREPRYLSLTEGDVPKPYEPPKLLYDEDIIRQAYYEDIDDGEIIKLKNNDRKSRSQVFIDEYFKLKSKQKTHISHSKLFRLTLEYLQQNGHPIMFKIGIKITCTFLLFDQTKKQRTFSTKMSIVGVHQLRLISSAE
jgi:small subunit ribosomal protein S23